MSDEMRAEARSLLTWLDSWGDGPNWSDASGATVPVVKEGLRRVLEHVVRPNLQGESLATLNDVADTQTRRLIAEKHEQARLIRLDAQNIVDLATCRLRDPRVTDPNVRHDLEQIVFAAKRLHRITGEPAIDPAALDQADVTGGFPTAPETRCNGCGTLRGTVDDSGRCISCRAVRDMLADEAKPR